MQKKIKLITTGGTIASVPNASSGGLEPKVTGHALLERITNDNGIVIEVHDLFNVPSDNIGYEEWNKLRTEIEKTFEDEEFDGIVVTHGTDSLEETAFYLDLVLDGHKPVVITGAQRHFMEADSDAVRNLSDSIHVAAHTQAYDKGVLIVFNGRIIPGRHARKVHTNFVDAFNGGEYGAIGSIEHGDVSFLRSPIRSLVLPVKPDTLPRVEIVAAYSGAGGELVRSAIDLGAKGLVIQAMGMGNVSSGMFRACVEAMERGVIVAISTRVPSGRVHPLYGFDGGGQKLMENGALFAEDLSPHKARIFLQLVLSVTYDRNMIINFFQRYLNKEVNVGSSYYPIHSKEQFN